MDRERRRHAPGHRLVFLAGVRWNSHWTYDLPTPGWSRRPPLRRPRRPAPVRTHQDVGRLGVSDWKRLASSVTRWNSSNLKKRLRTPGFSHRLARRKPRRIVPIVIGGTLAALTAVDAEEEQAAGAQHRLDGLERGGKVGVRHMEKAVQGVDPLKSAAGRPKLRGARRPQGLRPSVGPC